MMDEMIFYYNDERKPGFPSQKKFFISAKVLKQNKNSSTSYGRKAAALFH